MKGAASSSTSSLFTLKFDSFSQLYFNSKKLYRKERGVDEEAVPFIYEVISVRCPFFWVLVTIEPGRTLLQFVTTNCLIISVKTTYVFQTVLCTVL